MKSATVFERVLARLLPPRLPGFVRGWDRRCEVQIIEEGWAGNVRPKKYRNGIERYWSEQVSDKMNNDSLENVRRAK
jgi:hypothetical protein